MLLFLFFYLLMHRLSLEERLLPVNSKKKLCLLTQSHHLMKIVDPKIYEEKEIIVSEYDRI